MFLWALLGLFLVIFILWDGFETMVLTQTITDRYRFTRFFYFATRPRYYKFASGIKNERLRHAMLLIYAPLSLVALISAWAALVIFGYSLINFGLQIPHREGNMDLGSAMYYSGVTFLTLGYGDIAPITALGRWLAVIEAGTGLVFLASVVGFIPVFYGAVQRREIPIIMLDSKASSNPSGFELLRRHSAAGATRSLTPFLERYEFWGSELLEAYLAYPVIAFYRSQHRDQNWLKTATAIMDACALIESTLDCQQEYSKELRFQAKATFASMRHMLVDLAYVIRMAPKEEIQRTLTREDHLWMIQELEESGLAVRKDEVAWEALEEIRKSYEPFVSALSEGLVMTLPEWRRSQIDLDNWQVSAWDGSKHSKPDASPTELVSNDDHRICAGNSV